MKTRSLVLGLSLLMFVALGVATAPAEAGGHCVLSVSTHQAMCETDTTCVAHACLEQMRACVGCD